MKQFTPCNNLIATIDSMQKKYITTTFTAGGYVGVMYIDNDERKRFSITFYEKLSDNTWYNCIARIRNEDKDEVVYFDCTTSDMFTKKLVEIAGEQAEEYMFIIEYGAYLLEELRKI